MISGLRSRASAFLFPAFLLGVALLLKPAFLASQDSAIPLKDVCPDGWTRYDCNDGIRLCTSPDFRSTCESNRISCDNSLRYLGECHESKWVIPDGWVHDTIEDYGFTKFEPTQGYHWHTKVVLLDSSSLSSKEDLDHTLKSMHQYGAMEKARENHDEWRRSIPDEVDEEWKRSGWPPPIQVSSLEEYGLSHPKPPASRDVCPTGWSRYSCELVRLCVAPSVIHHYALVTSKEFKDALCEADVNTVPSDWVDATPKDVGYAAGALLLGPRYLKTVNLDISNIIDGDVDEAIQRLVLVPVTARMYAEYLHGLGAGITDFQSFLAKNRKKAQLLQKNTK